MADEALGALLDAYLVAELLSRLGQHSSYSDLQVETALATIVRDQEDWRAWARPALVVTCRSVRRAPGPHGDGDLHIGKRYNYVVATICDGDQASALRDARILERRLELALREIAVSLDLVDAAGEQTQTVEIGDSLTLMYRNRTAQQDNWQAVAAIAFTVESLL
jgi:hypothetical protein